MSDVMVVDYDAGWPVSFEALRRAIWPAVSDIAHAIEHVGSTAVPGLAAKPVIDMDVVVEAADLVVCIGRLESLGYRHRGDLGVHGREAFAPPPGAPKHHLYLCPSDSPALANHLAVRDYLRTHEEAAAEYGALKKRLASDFPGDMAGYIEGKTEFLLGVLRSAGFPDDLLADVARANARPMTPASDGAKRRRLLVVKVLHTVVWAFFAGCIVAIPVTAWRGQLAWAGILSGVVFLEVLVLLFNGMRCPLTPVAARYTDDRRANFDIFLPEWLARYNKEVFGTLYALGLLILVYRLFR